MTPSRISATRSWSEKEPTALQGLGERAGGPSEGPANAAARAARWVDVHPAKNAGATISETRQGARTSHNRAGYAGVNRKGRVVRRATAQARRHPSDN